MMVAHLEAVARGERMATYDVEGVRLTCLARAYPSHCWLWLVFGMS